MRMLELRHPAEFNAILSPKFRRDSFMDQFCLSPAFLFGLRWKGLNDPILARTCWLLITIYVVLTALLIWAFAIGPSECSY